MSHTQTFLEMVYVIVEIILEILNTIQENADMMLVTALLWIRNILIVIRGISNILVMACVIVFLIVIMLVDLKMEVSLVFNILNSFVESFHLVIDFFVPFQIVLNLTYSIMNVR